MTLVPDPFRRFVRWLRHLAYGCEGVGEWTNQQVGEGWKQTCRHCGRVYYLCRRNGTRLRTPCPGCHS